MDTISWPTISKDAGLFWARYKKLSKKDLLIVAATGIPSSTLSTWKSKRKYPRADEAYKIAKTLNTTVEYLITGEEPANTMCPPPVNEIKEEKSA